MLTCKPIITPIIVIILVVFASLDAMIQCHYRNYQSLNCQFIYMSHYQIVCHIVTACVTLSVHVSLCHCMCHIVTACVTLSLHVSHCHCMCHFVTACVTLSLHVSRCHGFRLIVLFCHLEIPINNAVIIDYQLLVSFKGTKKHKLNGYCMK